jgi:hypothetical protein
MVFKIYSEILAKLYIKINSKLKINSFFSFLKLSIDFLEFLYIFLLIKKNFFLGKFDKII